MNENCFEYELAIKPDEICRTCLGQTNDLKSIFFSDIVDGKIVAFPNVIYETVNIKVIKGDGLPEKICSTCKIKINEYYTFKEKCNKSNILLNTVFGKSVPEESTQPIIELPSTSKSQEPLNEDQSLQTPINVSEKIEEESVEESIEKPMKVEIDEEEYLDEEWFDETLGPATPEIENTKTDSTQKSIDNLKKFSNPETLSKIKNSINDDSKKIIKFRSNQKDSFTSVASSSSNQMKKHCILCNTTIKGEDKIAWHIFFHINTLGMMLDNFSIFKCARCIKTFNDQEQFLEHLKSFENDDVDDNKSCKKSINLLDDSTKCKELEFFDINEIECDNKKLISCMYDNEYDLYYCTQCDDYTDTSLENLIEHINDNHKKYKKSEIEFFYCSYCNEWTDNINEILIHMYRHLKTYPCPFDNCGNEYMQFLRLNTHIEQSHIETNKTSSCKYCFKNFNTNNELLKHLRSECSIRNFECDVCKKRFLSKRTLQIHEKIHQDDRKYMCSFCGKNFIQCGDLKIHMRTHTGEKPYKCTICPKRFRTQGHRQDHIGTHGDEKNFKCEICQKCFKAERILKGHMILHTGTKKFNCPHCNRQFTRRAHVVSHLRTHNKNNPIEKNDRVVKIKTEAVDLIDE